MENEFLASVEQESKPITTEDVEKVEDKPAEEEKGTPAESPTEIKPEDKQTDSPAEEVKDDKPLEDDAKEEPVIYHSFEKHPRWKAREEELKELRKTNEKLREFQERAEPLLERIEKAPLEEKSKAIPRWAETLGWGQGDWDEYRQSTTEDRKQVKEELLKELKPFIEASERSKKQTDLDNWAKKEWKFLEEDSAVKGDLKKLGLTFTKEVQNEISGVITKYLPTDEETGNISPRKGFEIWKDIKSRTPLKPSEATTEKKKVANKTIDKTATTLDQKDFRTSADFVGKSFADL